MQIAKTESAFLLTDQNVQFQPSATAATVITDDAAAEANAVQQMTNVQLHVQQEAVATQTCLHVTSLLSLKSAALNLPDAVITADATATGNVYL